MFGILNRLILANPGTGKTTVLATRVVDLLKEGAQPKEILCITFTEKAANEMSQKIREIAEKENLNAKLHELSIHTFHSYALSYLEEADGAYNVLGNNSIRYSIFKSFETNNALNYSKEYVIGDIVPKVENAIRYIKSYGITPEDIHIEKCIPEIEVIYHKEEISNITLEEQIKFAEYFLNAFQDYEKSKKNGYIDYNDMLLYFMKLNDKKKFKFVLVDELQDVNELEAEIAIQSGEELFLVGDRKQSIFGFQGGSVRNFKIIEEKLKPEKKKLVKNYRSAKEIIEYASGHFRNKTAYSEYAEELEGFSPERKSEGVVKIIETGRGNQELLAIKTALELQDSKTTAIITRSNSQILSISKLLDSKGVKYSTTISNATSTEAKGTIVNFLKGILHDDYPSIINALFTPFSGTKLKEAFEISKIYNDRKLNKEEFNKRVPSFIKLKESAFSKQALVKLFDEIILPISVSIGKDYYITAFAMRKNILEFFETIPTPQITDFFNYLDVTEESYEPMGQQEKLVLTTVHKSKGLEFENVIYVPRSTRNSFSFVDAVVYGMIKSAKGIDIANELEEEALRVDFVAFTRARDRLIIIANNSNSGDYTFENYNVDKYEAIEDEPEPISRKFDEAYGLFVNKRYEDAKKALNAKDPWLKNHIHEYFAKTNRLSYTMIESINNPFEFLQHNILGLREENISLNMGNIAHAMAENRYKGTLDKNALTVNERPFLKNIEKLDQEIQKKFNAKQTDAELTITLPLEEIIGKGRVPKEMEFKAKIDAVYKSDKNYLIVDWKTDKTTENAANHRRQLATYRKLYSIANRIKEDDINTAICFIALRGKINTGKLDYMLDDQQPKSQQFETVLKHINNFAAYKENPELFIAKLLGQADQSILHKITKQELS